VKVLRPGVDPDAFFRGLASAQDRLLLLDYDGTLAPFRERRDQALPYPGVVAAVERILAGGHTRVVVVSGRAVQDLRPLLGLDPPPRIWGNHGWERLDGEGRLERVPLALEARRALERAGESLAAPALAGRVETKPASLAVHVRGLPEDEARRLLEELRSAWEPLAGDTGLEVHDFDGGLELRPAGRHKGTAVEEALRDEPPGVVAAYLGDDRTDEDAFRALAGRGLTVLVRAEPRETAADLWIRPPGELLEFLARWDREAGGTP